MSSDSKGDVLFECLRCGKTSILENLHAKQPRCVRCGSGSGVLGDIGQGTAEARRSRGHGSERKPPCRPVQFECLSCGHSTEVTDTGEPVPHCVHCGSWSGIVADSRNESSG